MTFQEFDVVQWCGFVQAASGVSVRYLYFYHIQYPSCIASFESFEPFDFGGIDSINGKRIRSEKGKREKGNGWCLVDGRL